FPGTALAAGLLLVAWLVPGRGDRPGRGIALIGGTVAVAGLLVLPQAIDIASGAGRGLASTVGRPSFASLLRLAPSGGPGSWSVSWFLPAAAVFSYTLVEGWGRAATRYLLVAVAAVFMAWAAAAGYLPHAVSN